MPDESDGASDLTEKLDFADDYDDEPNLADSVEAQEWIDMATQPPPWWASVMIVVGWGLVALVFGVTVMAQWVLWMVLGSSFLGVVGIALGGLVAAVQMWLLFGTPNVNESCDLP